MRSNLHWLHAIAFLILLTGCLPANNERSRKPTLWTVFKSFGDADKNWDYTIALGIGNAGDSGSCTARENAVFRVKSLRSKPTVFPDSDNPNYTVAFDADLTEGGYVTCQCTRVEEIQENGLLCEHMYSRKSRFDSDQLFPLCAPGYSPAHSFKDGILTVTCTENRQ